MVFNKILFKKKKLAIVYVIYVTHFYAGDYDSPINL
jgi:hypothetical protein